MLACQEIICILLELDIRLEQSENSWVESKNPYLSQESGPEFIVIGEA